MGSWRKRLLVVGLCLGGATAWAGGNSSKSGGGGGDSGGGGSGGFKPLSSAVIPRPSGGDVINQDAAVRLGKALFWDEQVGGDGKVACASCHFHSGTDNRMMN